MCSSPQSTHVTTDAVATADSVISKSVALVISARRSLVLACPDSYCSSLSAMRAGARVDGTVHDPKASGRGPFARDAAVLNTPGSNLMHRTLAVRTRLHAELLPIECCMNNRVNAQPGK